jgi:hypothetical protein
MTTKTTAAIDSAEFTESFPRTQSVLLPEPLPDRAVKGRVGISIDRPTTLFVGFYGGEGVKVLYGEEAHRPVHPLPIGITKFNYNPPNQFHLEYTIEPGASGFKLGWGYNLR